MHLGIFMLFSKFVFLSIGMSMICILYNNLSSAKHALAKLVSEQAIYSES